MCGGVTASLGCSRDAAQLPSPALQRFLGPLTSLCDQVRATMGLAEKQEPASDEEKADLLLKTTEASVKEQIRKIIASKVIQANWAGKKSCFDGTPDAKVEIHGCVSVGEGGRAGGHEPIRQT